MKKFFLLSLVAFILVGCESATERKMVNDYSLKNPIIVGETENGEVVKCYVIRSPDGGSPYDHYIYVVEGSKTVSNNYKERACKTTHNEVQVNVTPYLK